MKSYEEMLEETVRVSKARAMALGITLTDVLLLDILLRLRLRDGAYGAPKKKPVDFYVPDAPRSGGD